MDADAFKQRFLPLHPKLYRIAYALLSDRDDAEDLLQELYCKLWDRRNELEAVRNPEAFAVTLTRNLCIDFLRARKPGWTMDGEEPENLAIDTGSTPEQEMEGKEEVSRVRRLIERLPENQRRVIRLRGFEDRSFEEIGELTGLSSSNVRTLLSRARRWIREQMEIQER